MRMFPAVLLASCIAASSLAYAQNPQSPKPDQGLPASDLLYKTVADLDTRLFDAYNHCQLDMLSSLVTDDLEFYHDKTGLSVGRQLFVDAIRKNICGKVHRELVPGTLEVYPLAGFGAIEIGVHRFSHPDDPHNLGEAKFVTIWQLKDGSWKMTRAISFDHHAADPVPVHPAS